MSRKSTRVTKGKRQRKDCDEEIETTFSKKRKAEESPETDMEIKKRRQQFQLQNQWVPISDNQGVATCTILPSPELASPQRCTPKDLIIGSAFRFQNYFTTPIDQRQSPLPRFQWADSQEVWLNMLKKEEIYTRDQQMLHRHPSLQPRMRSILLDWIIEVCEVYRLHRETYYLSMDFIDRYLATTKNIQKQELQLIGITALFVAAKLEEIYPPKLKEFAYVTDGACTENEILVQELVMLKLGKLENPEKITDRSLHPIIMATHGIEPGFASMLAGRFPLDCPSPHHDDYHAKRNKALKWDLSPMTVNSWLNVYLQLVNMDNLEEKEDSFVYPQYSQHAFIQIARLLDLCTLDITCLQYTYSVLATSALYHMSSEQEALSVSGFQWMDIAPCVQWMAPFAITLREAGPVELKFFQSVSSENAHNIQTHAVDLPLMEKAQARQDQMLSTLARASPDFTKEIPGIITPPQSREKVKEGSEGNDEDT